MTTLVDEASNPTSEADAAAQPREEPADQDNADAPIDLTVASLEGSDQPDESLIEEQVLLDH